VESNEDLGATSLEVALQVYGIVSGVEHEQRRLLLPLQAIAEPPHLLGGDLVGVLFGSYAPGIHRRHPRVALKGELGD
jgi:hypothetical protein